MANFNQVILMGNVVKDIELKYTATGKAVTNLRIAVNRKYKSEDKIKEETFFTNVVVWGKTAELCDKYLKKGSGVMVTGYLRSREYEVEDRKNTITEVVADDILFLDKLTNTNTVPPAGVNVENMTEFIDEELWH
jgi:single-strand DNA-binding protein